MWLGLFDEERVTPCLHYTLYPLRSTMTTMFRLPWRLFKRPFVGRPASPVRQFAQSKIPLLDTSDKLEEETLPWYTRDGFYPVNIGQVFQSRYQVIGKLGFGGYSTVWLCRDLKYAYLLLAWRMIVGVNSVSDSTITSH